VKKPKAARVAVLDGEVLLRPLRALLPKRATWLPYRDFGREHSVDRPRFTGIFRAKGVLMQELPYDAFGTIRDRTTAPATSWDGRRAARRIDAGRVLGAVCRCHQRRIEYNRRPPRIGFALAPFFAFFRGAPGVGTPGKNMQRSAPACCRRCGIGPGPCKAAGSSTAAGFTGPFMPAPLPSVTASVRSDV
jgi:hypothetical protein